MNPKRFLRGRKLPHKVTPDIEHSSSSGEMQPPQGQSGLGKKGYLTSSRNAKPAWVMDQQVREVASRPTSPLSRCHVSTALQKYVQNNRKAKGLTLLPKNCSSWIMFSDERGKLGISRGSSLTFCLLNVCLKHRDTHTHNANIYQIIL